MSHPKPTVRNRVNRRKRFAPRRHEMAQRHVHPESFDEPMHDLDGFCWCQPVVEHLFGGDLYIHRRTLDSPHYEEAG